MDPNGRVHVIENPTSNPGTCLMCQVGSGVDSRKFIDFGISFDWYGSVIFCEYCFSAVAEVVGFVSTIESETANALTAAISKKADQLNKENKVLKHALAELCRSNSIDSDLIERLVYPTGSSNTPEGTSSSNDGGEQATNESDSKQGSKRVRSSSKSATA